MTTINLISSNLESLAKLSECIDKLQDIVGGLEDKVKKKELNLGNLDRDLEDLYAQCGGRSVEDYGNQSDESEGEFENRKNDERELDQEAYEEINDVEGKIEEINDEMDKIKAEIKKLQDKIGRKESKILLKENRIDEIAQSLYNIVSSKGSVKILKETGTTSGALLEILALHLMKNEYQGMDVQRVGGKCDKGVDILIKKEKSDEIVGIVQCKQGRQASSKGSSIVRELVGACVLHGTKSATLVVTVDQLTSETEKDISLFSQRGYKIDTILASRIKRLIMRMKPCDYENLLKDFKSTIVK